MKDYFSIIIAFIGAVSLLISNYIGGDTDTLKSILIISTTIIVLLSYYAIKAYHSLSSIEDFPSPKGFWSFVFNRLPTSKGQKYTTPVTQLTLVCYSGDVSEANSKEILEKFDELKNTVEIRQFFLEESITENGEKLEIEKQKLLKKLNGSEAVIMFRTMIAERNQWIFETIDQWTATNSHIPCLVIDKLSADNKEQLANEKIELSKIPDKYNSIDLQNSSSIPWRMIKRANERASLWREQASVNRSIAGWIFTVMCFGIAGALIHLDMKITSEELEKSKRFSEMKELTKSVFTSTDSIDFQSSQKIINNYSTLCLNYYTDIVGIERFRGSLSLSFWKKRNENGKDYNFQIGWSDRESNQEYYSFLQNTTSIVGCSFSYPSNFVFWERDNKIPSDRAIWSKEDGKTIGNWNPDSDKIILNSSNGLNESCEYLRKSSNTHTAMLCLAFKRATSPDENFCGVCIDSKNADANEYLKSDISLRFLAELVEQVSQFNPIHFIPNNLEERAVEIERNE